MGGMLPGDAVSCQKKRDSADEVNRYPDFLRQVEGEKRVEIHGKECVYQGDVERRLREIDVGSPRKGSECDDPQQGRVAFGKGQYGNQQEECGDDDDLYWHSRFGLIE